MILQDSNNFFERHFSAYKSKSLSKKNVAQPALHFLPCEQYKILAVVEKSLSENPTTIMDLTENLSKVP